MREREREREGERSEREREDEVGLIAQSLPLQIVTVKETRIFDDISCHDNISGHTIDIVDEGF